MENLKSLHDLYEPDVRNRHRVDLNLLTGVVSETTIESIHSLIESIRLDQSVPENVHTHFSTAKNLVLYSWFVYELNVVGAMQAFASLELALRTKSGDKKTPFKHLIEKNFNKRKLTSGVGPPIELSVALSKLRNDLAHGSTTMHGQGIAVLRKCSELINELFA